MNPDPACIGDTITFTVSGVVDSGGEKRVDCVVNEEVPPVTPTYTWELTIPPDYPPPPPALSGSGSTASVVGKAPGTYSCTFTAEANRECPPPDHSIGPATGAPFVVEITTPNGNPTTTAGANATNERTYSTGADPIVTVPCAAASVPDPSKLRWTIDDVGPVRATWSPSVPGDPYTGTGLSPTATFTEMPPNYDDFGAKTITLTVDGLANCQDTQAVEIFYAGMATNHPGGSPTFPNWYYYYQQNEGSANYTYGCTAPPNPTSWSISGDPTSVHICDNAYTGGKYIATTVVGGQLQATGWSGTNRYYAHFLGVLAHERQHANNQINSGPPADRDNDHLANGFETAVSQTDPDNDCSAAGVLACPPFYDSEVYAGGPVEQGGIVGANTSEDWAEPGSNHR